MEAGGDDLIVIQHNNSKDVKASMIDMDGSYCHMCTMKNSPNTIRTEAWRPQKVTEPY